MATDLAADEPPVVHLHEKGEALSMDTAGERRVACEGRGLTTVDVLCIADKPASCAVPTVCDLCATDEPPSHAVSTVPELATCEELLNPEILNKDTIPKPLESNNNSQKDVSVDDSVDEQDEQSILQKRQERKQERSASKEKRKKRRKPKEGKAKPHINKERATAYNRFNIGYFAKIVDVVSKSNHRMEVVRNGGFGYLLELDDCYVPRPFAQWVADNISTKDESIVLAGKSIPLNPEAVSLILGIPAGGTKISMLDKESGRAEFLSLFGLTDLPSISFFGNKLIKEELPDDVYLRCFLTVALATFLCPTSNTKPSTKYLGALVDVSKSKDLDWCSLVHTWNMSYVRCLDFNNFGSIKIPQALPRICFWKGQTIKHFSDTLLGKDGLYEALEIKNEAETCYVETDSAWASTAKKSNIRKAIQRVLANSFSEKIKEDIFLNFQERVKDQNLTTCLIAKQVLLDTLNIVSSSCNGSQHIEKLESFDHLYMPTDEDNGSGSTIRVGSNGIEMGSGQSTLEVDREGVKAELHPVTWNAPTNEHKDQGESTNKVGRLKHNQDTNMMYAHSNILERNVNDCPIEIEAPEKSTSLNYMLLSARLAKSVMSTEQVINSKEVSSRDVRTTFAGDYNKRVELDIDINIAPSNNDKQQHIQELQDTLHPLDIARQKYFFADDMTPSRRILPDHDDCGNQITEPEFWRPLQMNSEEYNAQIEEAKKKYPWNASKDIEGQSSQDEQEVQGDSSIHCAQRQPVSTSICKYRYFLPQFKEKDGIIDLKVKQPINYNICL
ncbi:hypothetical protein VPH35_075219 [Triticum aestivum]